MGNSQAAAEFLRDMLEDNPFGCPDYFDGSEKWTNFDPPFLRRTVASFERRGWIETRGIGHEAQHRWTQLGHAEQLRLRLVALGYKVSRPSDVASGLAKPSPEVSHG